MSEIEERKTSVLKNRLMDISELIDKGDVDIDDLSDLIKETNKITEIIKERLENTRKMLDE